MHRPAVEQSSKAHRPAGPPEQLQSAGAPESKCILRGGSGTRQCLHLTAVQPLWRHKQLLVLPVLDGVAECDLQQACSTLLLQSLQSCQSIQKTKSRNHMRQAAVCEVGEWAAAAATDEGCSVSVRMGSCWPNSWLCAALLILCQAGRTAAGTDLGRSHRLDAAQVQGMHKHSRQEAPQTEHLCMLSCSRTDLRGESGLQVPFCSCSAQPWPLLSLGLGATPNTSLSY